MSKLFLSFGIAVLCFGSLAAEPNVRPYLFNGQPFFSDRPLVVLNDRLVYEDTKEDFIVATGARVDASYRTESKPLCIGCKNPSNSPTNVLRLLGVEYDKCLVKDSTPIVSAPVQPSTSATPNIALQMTAEESAWGGVKINTVEGKIVVYKTDGSFFYRADEKPPVTVTLEYQSPCANGMCHRQ